MKRATQQPAYVLHSYDWSESSLVLDLFLREHGRVAVVAKGAKRPYSQFRAVLLPFQRLLVSCSAGRGEQAEVWALRSAEWAGGPGLLHDGGALLAGFYLNELLMKLLPRQDPHPLLFDCYQRVLGWLAAADAVRTQAALRSFELMLLREHGVLPALDRVTLTQQTLEAGVRYTLRPDTGLALAADDEPGWPGVLSQRIEQALQASELDALHQLCELSLPELKSRLRVLLHYHLGHHPLHTRQLMHDLQSRER